MVSRFPIGRGGVSLPPAVIRQGDGWLSHNEKAAFALRRGLTMTGRAGVVKAGVRRDDAVLHTLVPGQSLPTALRVVLWRARENGARSYVGRFV
jgi:hypothetical protein